MTAGDVCVPVCLVGMVIGLEQHQYKTGWRIMVVHKEVNIRQHHKSNLNSDHLVKMSLAVGLSSALEVIGVKEYIGHVMGQLTGWLLEKAYKWWNGEQTHAVDVDVEREGMEGHDDGSPDDVESNLESTSLCIVSEFGVLDNQERSASCCGWRFAVSRDCVHEK